MSTAWAVFSFLAPPLAAVLAATIIRPMKPREEIVIALNAVLPGSGLAAAGQSTIEIVLGVLLAQVSLILTGGAHALWMYVPSMAVGGVWALLHTSLSPLARATVGEGEHLSRQIPDAKPAMNQPPARQTESKRQEEDDTETVI